MAILLTLQLFSSPYKILNPARIAKAIRGRLPALVYSSYMAKPALSFLDRAGAPKDVTKASDGQCYQQSQGKILEHFP
jgi:hypothetical protein